MRPNGSDSSLRDGSDTPFRAVGTGHYITRKCDECNKLTGRMAGGKTVRGMWWCAGCVAKKEGRG